MMWVDAVCDPVYGVACYIYFTVYSLNSENLVRNELHDLHVFDDEGEGLELL